MLLVVDFKAGLLWILPMRTFFVVVKLIVEILGQIYGSINLKSSGAEQYHWSQKPLDSFKSSSSSYYRGVSSTSIFLLLWSSNTPAPL